MQQVLIHHLLLKKTDLASLKSNVDKIDVDKLKTVPFIKLSNLVKNEVIKKSCV